MQILYFGNFSRQEMKIWFIWLFINPVINYIMFLIAWKHYLYFSRSPCEMCNLLLCLKRPCGSDCCFLSDLLSGCTFAQWVCDGHTDLRRQVLRWRRLCLRSDRLWPQWDYPLHTDLSRHLHCGKKCLNFQRFVCTQVECFLS